MLAAREKERVKSQPMVMCDKDQQAALTL